MPDFTAPEIILQRALGVLNSRFPHTNNAHLALLFKAEIQLQALEILLLFPAVHTAAEAVGIALNFNTDANIQNLIWLSSINLEANAQYILCVIAWPQLQIPESLSDFTLDNTPRSPSMEQPDVDLLNILLGQQQHEESKTTKRDCHLCVIM